MLEYCATALGQRVCVCVCVCTCVCLSVYARVCACGCVCMHKCVCILRGMCACRYGVCIDAESLGHSDAAVDRDKRNTLCD